MDNDYTKSERQDSGPPLSIQDKQNANRLAEYAKSDQVPFAEIENDGSKVVQILASITSPPVKPPDNLPIHIERDLKIKNSDIVGLTTGEQTEVIMKRLNMIPDLPAEQRNRFIGTLLEILEENDGSYPVNDDSSGKPDPVGDDVEYPAIQFRNLNEIDPKTIEWLVPGWIPKRALTLIAGQPGAGKTTLALALAAACSTGGFWGDHSVEKGEVILYCGEDTFPEVIVPNLIAQNADLDKIHNPIFGLDDDGLPESFNPGKHIALLKQELKKRRNVKLMVIDPAMSIASNVRDENRPNDIRKALEPVQSLAEDAGIAIVGITHFLKRHNATGSNILDRVLGSQAWGAVARMVLAVEQQNAGRACMRVKSNWGLNHGGFFFDIASEQVKKGIEGKYIQFGAGIDGSADSVIGKVADKDAPKTNEAIDWLIQYLEQYPDGVVWKDAETNAKEDVNITPTTLRYARTALKDDGKLSMKRLATKGGKTVWILNE